MNDATIACVSPESIAAVLQDAGYRATIAGADGAPQVQSAAQGLGFFVAFGNPATGPDAGWVDFAVQCALDIQGELPAGVIDDWNRGMRFARLYRHGQLLVLAMDVVVAGGVTRAFLSAQFELWDRILRDLVRHLRRDDAR